MVDKATLARRTPLDAENLEEAVSALFGNFELLSASAVAETSATVHGTNFRCATAVEQYRRLIETALPSSRAPGERQVEIVVALAGQPAAPVFEWNGEPWQDRIAETVLGKGPYRLHHFPPKNFWQFYDISTDRGIQLQSGVDGWPDWDPGSPLRNFLHWHFIQQGSALIHAGTLGIDGRGVLLAGMGGSGKSSTVLAGILHGLDCVGDDYVLASNTDSVIARRLFHTLKVDPDSAGRLGISDHPALRSQLNWQGKYQFTDIELLGRETATSLNIEALILPSVARADRSSFSPVSSKEAFLSLAPSGVFQVPGDREKNIAFCARLIRQLPCFRMNLSTNPSEIAAALSDFVRDVAR